MLRARWVEWLCVGCRQLSREAIVKSWAITGARRCLGIDDGCEIIADVVTNTASTAEFEAPGQDECLRKLVVIIDSDQATLEEAESEEPTEPIPTVDFVTDLSALRLGTRSSNEERRRDRTSFGSYDRVTRDAVSAWSNPIGCVDEDRA